MWRLASLDGPARPLGWWQTHFLAEELATGTFNRPPSSRPPLPAAGDALSCLYSVLLSGFNTICMMLTETNKFLCTFQDSGGSDGEVSIVGIFFGGETLTG